MNAAEAGDLLEQALVAIFEMSAPMLLAGLVVGVVISLIQAATQLQEVTIVFIPKMLAVGLVLWMAGPQIFDVFELLFSEVVMRIRGVSMTP